MWCCFIHRPHRGGRNFQSLLPSIYKYDIGRSVPARSSTSFFIDFQTIRAKPTIIDGYHLAAYMKHYAASDISEVYRPREVIFYLLVISDEKNMVFRERGACITWQYHIPAGHTRTLREILHYTISSISAFVHMSPDNFFGCTIIIK